MSIRPSLEEFSHFAEKGNLLPVYIELLADCETPVDVYSKLREKGENAFLFESAESSQVNGRYSFVGFDIRTELRFSRGSVEILQDGKSQVHPMGNDPLSFLQEFMGKYRPVPHGTLPSFYGGAVGFIGYESVVYFEPTVPRAKKDDLGIPDALFLLTDKLLIFDHLRKTLQIVVNVHTDDGGTLDGQYARALEQIARVRKLLEAPRAHELKETPARPEQIAPPGVNMTHAQYLAMTAQMQEYIKAGDIFQVVPSQRFELDFPASPLDLYRVLRHVNPSPYMFCLELRGMAIVGASPEVHVRCQNRKVEIRPIAGTRKRGVTPEEDAALEQELLADPKERAEHVMLIDLARNDVGRVCDFHSVKVTDFMVIERYSHVMHIVSHVEGRLHEGKTAYDVMRATFPAGTVSGSPKIRAMQIIAELEPTCRGIYSGAVGYFGFDGNLDSCIALRTVLLKDGKAYVQAGGGLVADSTPQGEYEESCNKARAALTAIAMARQIH
ncbi:anthranilate synthase component I [Kamptonema cortianum]|nr:anthranilate synthase component I [Kamptonema cortianum]